MEKPKSGGRLRRPTTIVLSRFFDGNVRLVAGICSRCHLEEDEVKIVAINRTFLKQAQARKNLKRTANSLHYYCSPDGVDAARQTYDNCQIDLKLPTATSTGDNYALITDLVSRQTKPRLSYNYNYKETTSLCTTENSTEYANEIDSKSVSDFFQIKNEKTVNFSQYQKSSEFQKINLTKLKKTSISKSQGQDEIFNSTPDIYGENQIKTENRSDDKFQKLNSTDFKIEKSPSSLNSQETPFWPLVSLKKYPPTSTLNLHPKTLKVENSWFQPYNGIVNLKKLQKQTFPIWTSPRSPHNLIEESLFRDPWSLLVATIFLNKTSCMCARPRVVEFLRDFPNPWKVLEKHPSELEKYFLDLGLYKKRAEQVWRMSHDYVHKNWKNAKELYGIGKYGEDAYRMFVLGDLEIEPTDRFLRIYRDWAKMKEKEEKMMGSKDD